MSVKPVRRSGYCKRIYTTMDKHTKFNLAAKACETRDKETARKYLNEIIDENTPMANIFANNLILSYRMLLTRAVKGVSLYIRDKETREHVRQLLNA